MLNAFVLISILADIATWIIRYVFDPGWREDQVAVVVDGDLEEESLPLLGGDDDEGDGESDDKMMEERSKIKSKADAISSTLEV